MWSVLPTTPATLIDLILPLLLLWSLTVQLRQMLPHRRRTWRVRSVHAALAIVSLALLVVTGPSGPRSAALAQSAPTAGAAQVSITSTGFQPPLATVNLGQTVHFSNATAQPQSVTHDGVSTSGTVLFDSG